MATSRNSPGGLDSRKLLAIWTISSSVTSDIAGEASGRRARLTLCCLLWSHTTGQRPPKALDRAQPCTRRALTAPSHLHGGHLRSGTWPPHVLHEMHTPQCGR